MKKKQKTLGQIAYDATPNEGGKSNFGTWDKAPEVVRRVHEKMAKKIEQVVTQRVREEILKDHDGEVSRRLSEAMTEPFPGCRIQGFITGSQALNKACSDSFDYALGLRSGAVFRFTSATLLNREWIHLVHDGDRQALLGFGYTFPRGIDVRIEDIAWVADAPAGS